MNDDEKLIIRTAAIVLSVLLNLLVLHFLPVYKADAKMEDSTIIELVNLSKPDPIPLDKPPELMPRNGQIVDLGPDDPNDETKPPDNTKFLSERNARTEKETVKPSQGRTGSPGASSDRHSNKRNRSPEQRSKIKSDSPEQDEKPIRPKRTKNKKFAEPVIIAKADKETVEKKDLMVSMADINRAMEGDDGSIDYLPHVPKGSLTSLNSMRFAYASFYNRMKRAIRFYWRPEPVLDKINWRGARLETKLMVVLEADGKLGSVDVIDSCGFPIVDAAAIQAVRKAAPFFNVPQPLLDENNQLRDVWSFHITSM